MKNGTKWYGTNDLRSMTFFKKYKNFSMNVFLSWEWKIFLDVKFKYSCKNSIFKNIYR